MHAPVYMQSKEKEKDVGRERERKNLEILETKLKGKKKGRCEMKLDQKMIGTK